MDEFTRVIMGIVTFTVYGLIQEFIIKPLAEIIWRKYVYYEQTTLHPTCTKISFYIDYLDLRFFVILLLQGKTTRFRRRDTQLLLSERLQSSGTANGHDDGCHVGSEERISTPFRENHQRIEPELSSGVHKRNDQEVQ